MPRYLFQPDSTPGRPTSPWCRRIDVVREDVARVQHPRAAYALQAVDVGDLVRAQDRAIAALCANEPPAEMRKSIAENAGRVPPTCFHVPPASSKRPTFTVAAEAVASNDVLPVLESFNVPVCERLVSMVKLGADTVIDGWRGCSPRQADQSPKARRLHPMRSCKNCSMTT